MDEDHTYLMVYAPVGRPFGVRTSVLAEGKLKGWWFNPRNGKSHSAGKIARGDNVTFISPTPGEQTDWVLVIDLASAGYKRPYVGRRNVVGENLSLFLGGWRY